MSPIPRWLSIALIALLPGWALGADSSTHIHVRTGNNWVVGAGRNVHTEVSIGAAPTAKTACANIETQTGDTRYVVVGEAVNAKITIPAKTITCTQEKP